MEKIKLIFITILFIPLILSGQVDSGYVDIKGGVLFYRVFGEGEPLVFLNGGPGFSSEGYEMYAEAFASKKRKVILFDQRGTGKSKLKKKRKFRVSINNMVKDIEKLREHLNIKNWDVMGHSFGGHYALAYAAKYPEKIRKMVLSASPNLEPHNDWLQDFVIPVFDKMIPEEQEVFVEIEKEANQPIPKQGKIYRLKMGLKARFYVYKKENIRKAMEWFIYKCQPTRGLVLDMGFLGKRTKNYRKLKKFSQPVLIIHGISDFINIAAPLDNHKMFPNSELKIIYESGHMILLDQPAEYKATIESFLNKT